jgi:predicted dehydrogenase
MPTPRIGILGLGVMGKTHLAAYRAAAKDHLASVTAVLDPAAGAATAAGNLNTAADAPDLTGVEIFRDTDAFFDRAQIDAVSICTPTDTHVALAERALDRGLHVLCEKPVALAAADIRRLDAAAVAARRVCMPAMVMRYWPGWPWLRDRIRDQRFGPLRTLALERLGSHPAWNKSFYADPARSGGAMVDLHIHDADFVHWCFGRPDSVATAGSPDQVTTIYRVLGPTGPLVTATGGWAQHPAFGFRMRYLANFDLATVEFDLARTPHPVTISDATGTHPVPPEDLGTISAYEAQARHFLAVLAGQEPPRATLAEAAAVADLLALERKSLDLRGCGRWP